MNVFLTYSEIESLIEKKLSVRPTLKFIDPKRVEVRFKPVKLLPEMTVQLYIEVVTCDLIGLRYDCSAMTAPVINTAVKLFESKIPKWVCIMPNTKMISVSVETPVIKELQNTFGDDIMFDIESCGAGVMAMLADELQMMHIKANAGDADMQYNLADSYRNGINGVERNYELAVKWYRAAAGQGNADAQCELGYCYEKGIGVEKDEEEAFDWFRLSAEQGDAVAQHNLAVCYENGIGVEQDEEEAVEWYRAAAEQGDADAAKRLEELGIEV